jgi:multimeric flavodoxin WrbA
VPGEAGPVALALRGPAIKHLRHGERFGAGVPGCEEGVTARTLLIVWHSATGGTQQMAQAAFEGAAAEPDVTTRLLRAADAQAGDVLAADGYLFACPENLATMVGVMKDFFDRCYYDVLEQVNGRPYAAMICAGSDGAGTVRQITRIVTGWRLRAVADPLVIHTHAQTRSAIQAPKLIGAHDLARCRDLGAALAAGLAAGVF